MGYNTEALTNDCYPNTAVLINKLNIIDQTILSEVEALITTVKIAQLEEKPLAGNFDFKHYCDVHFFIYNELYDWAGKTRTIDISKRELIFAQQIILVNRLNLFLTD